MPELPEAETIVRGLRRRIVGERITRAEVVRPDILREPRRRFTPRVRDRRITAVDRRAKNVLIRFDDHQVLAVNLGMTGRLLPFAAPPRGRARPTHVAVRFRFESGGLLIFDDVRRFGTVECLSADAWNARSASIGPEPLESSYRASDMCRALQASRAPIRSWLLDQRRIAGVGNIYAAEALFMAGIHPARRARDLRRGEVQALHHAVRKVLTHAIEAGGTTIRDYRNAEGGEGRYARRLHVYGREGEPCVRCSAAVSRIVFGNRAAFYCPRCQPEHVTVDGDRRPQGYR